MQIPVHGQYFALASGNMPPSIQALLPMTLPATTKQAYMHVVHLYVCVPVFQVSPGSLDEDFHTEQTVPFRH